MSKKKSKKTRYRDESGRFAKAPDPIEELPSIEAAETENVGSERRPNGTWLERPEGSAPIIDSSRSQELNKIRWDAHREANANAIIQSARDKGHDINNIYEALAIGAVAMYEEALDGSPAAMKTVNQMVDATPRADKSQTTIQDNRQIHITMKNFTGLAENIREFAELFRQKGKPEVAAYLIEQIDEESEYPQTVSYPNETISYK